MLFQDQHVKYKVDARFVSRELGIISDSTTTRRICEDEDVHACGGAVGCGISPVHRRRRPHPFLAIDSEHVYTSFLPCGQAGVETINARIATIAIQQAA
jgi:hypothetical protein